jgi:hypothetical protein
MKTGYYSITDMFAQTDNFLFNAQGYIAINNLLSLRRLFDRLAPSDYEEEVTAYTLYDLISYALDYEHDDIALYIYKNHLSSLDINETGSIPNSIIQFGTEYYALWVARNVCINISDMFDFCTNLIRCNYSETLAEIETLHHIYCVYYFTARAKSKPSITSRNYLHLALIEDNTDRYGTINEKLIRIPHGGDYYSWSKIKISADVSIELGNRVLTRVDELRARDN